MTKKLFADPHLQADNSAISLIERIDSKHQFQKLLLLELALINVIFDKQAIFLDTIQQSQFDLTAILTNKAALRQKWLNHVTLIRKIIVEVEELLDLEALNEFNRNVKHIERLLADEADISEKQLQLFLKHQISFYNDRQCIIYCAMLIERIQLIDRIIVQLTLRKDVLTSKVKELNEKIAKVVDTAINPENLNKKGINLTAKQQIELKQIIINHCDDFERKHQQKKPPKAIKNTKTIIHTHNSKQAQKENSLTERIDQFFDDNHIKKEIKETRVSADIASQVLSEHEKLFLQKLELEKDISDIQSKLKQEEAKKQSFIKELQKVEARNPSALNRLKPLAKNYDKHEQKLMQRLSQLESQKEKIVGELTVELDNAKSVITTVKDRHQKTMLESAIPNAAATALKVPQSSWAERRLRNKANKLAEQKKVMLDNSGAKVLHADTPMLIPGSNKNK